RGVRASVVRPRAAADPSADGRGSQPSPQNMCICTSTHLSSATNASGMRPGTLCNVIGDRKSTRLNSSHVSISYAVFCLKKKKIFKSSVEQERSDRYNSTKRHNRK